MSADLVPEPNTCSKIAGTDRGQLLVNSPVFSDIFGSNSECTVPFINVHAPPPPPDPSLAFTCVDVREHRQNKVSSNSIPGIKVILRCDSWDDCFECLFLMSSSACVSLSLTGHSNTGLVITFSSLSVCRPSWQVI